LTVNYFGLISIPQPEQKGIPVISLEDCEEVADLWLIMKDVSADDRIEAYVRRGRRFEFEPVEALRVLYQQSEQNWALGPKAPVMSADGEDAECELSLRGALAPQEELIHANELKRNWINAWIAREAGEEGATDETENTEGERMN
jgi:hypothetical protein